MRRLTLICWALFTLLPAVSCRAGEIVGRISPPNKNLCIDLLSHIKQGNGEYLRDTELNPKTGAFVFKSVAPGSYDLPIYGDGPRLIPVTKSNIRVGSGKTNVGLIKLEKSAWIVGRIVSSSRDAEIQNLDLNLSGVDADEHGRFEINGIPMGKHKFEIKVKGYMPRAYEVNVTKARVYDLGKIRLSPLGGISGVIHIKGSPAAEYLAVTEDLHADAGLRSEIRRQGSRDGYSSWDYPRFKSNSSIAYKLPCLRPGRYYVSILGPGFAVMPIVDFPADSASQEDKIAASDLIISLGEALSKGDKDAISRQATSECRMNQSLLKELDINRPTFEGRRVHDRKIILLRATPDIAAAYTRGISPTVKVSDDPGLQLQPDAVELWKLKKDNSVWRLSDYQLDIELSQLLNMVRLNTREPKPLVKIPPPFVLIMTDDPKLTDIEVKLAETTSGHDFTVELQ